MRDHESEPREGSDMEKADKVIDRHDVPDIFCDGTIAITYRHNVCRITLHSDRVDPVDGKVNRVVIGHLLMSPASFVDFYNMLSGAMERMRKAGLVQRHEPTTPLAETH